MDDLLGRLTPVAKGADVREVVSEERINAMQDLICALWRGDNIRDEPGMYIGRSVGGVGLRFRQRRGRRGGGSGLCQLGSYTVDPDDTGKVVLIPGWLHAPNKSVLIEPGPMTPIANSKVWIKCPWTATLNDDDVLEAGGELGNPVVEGGSTIPDNVIPHVDSLTGIFHVPLGGWDDDKKWIREGCGSITVEFCPRVFSIKRGGEA